MNVQTSSSRRIVQHVCFHFSLEQLTVRHKMVRFILGKIVRVRRRNAESIEQAAACIAKLQLHNASHADTRAASNLNAKAVVCPRDVGLAEVLVKALPELCKGQAIRRSNTVLGALGDDSRKVCIARSCWHNSGRSLPAAGSLKSTIANQLAGVE